MVRFSYHRSELPPGIGMIEPVFSRITGILILVFIATGCSVNDRSGQSAVSTYGGGMESPRVFVSNNGGNILSYVVDMRRMERSGKPIRFAGRCFSACTVYLALPPDQICVSPGATFGFHLPNGVYGRQHELAAKYLLDTYPEWVKDWLDAKGGLTTQTQVMGYHYAQQYLPDCRSGKIAGEPDQPAHI
jgi:hypothetical protein